MLSALRPSHILVILVEFFFSLTPVLCLKPRTCLAYCGVCLELLYLGMLGFCIHHESCHCPCHYNDGPTLGRLPHFIKEQNLPSNSLTWSSRVPGVRLLDLFDWASVSTEMPLSKAPDLLFFFPGAPQSQVCIHSLCVHPVLWVNSHRD